MLPSQAVPDSGSMAWEIRDMRTWITMLLFLLVAETCSAQWTPQESGTKARLRGLSMVSRDIAWASGSEGTCLRTTDGGKTRGAQTVPGASSLDFRDIHGTNAATAYILSIGEGEKSRIYKS